MCYRARQRRERGPLVRFTSSSRPPCAFLLPPAPQDLSKIKAELDVVRSAYAELDEELNALAQQERKMRAMYSKQESEKKSLSAEVQKQTSKLRMLQLKRHTALYRSKINNIALTFESGSYDDVSDEYTTSVGDLSDELDSHNTEEARRIFEQEAAIRFDFSPLQGVRPGGGGGDAPRGGCLFCSFGDCALTRHLWCRSTRQTQPRRRARRLLRNSSRRLATLAAGSTAWRPT